MHRGKKMMQQNGRQCRLAVLAVNGFQMLTVVEVHVVQCKEEVDAMIRCWDKKCTDDSNHSMLFLKKILKKVRLAMSTQKTQLETLSPNRQLIGMSGQLSLGPDRMGQYRVPTNSPTLVPVGTLMNVFTRVFPNIDNNFGRHF